MSRPLIGLVEDNDHDFHAYKRVFSSLGALRRWTSGEELIGAILADATLIRTLDLLIVDLGLPGIDGVHIAHTVRSTPGGEALPIVVLTGSAHEPDILRALEAEVSEYEVKPQDIKGLRALAERIGMLLQPAEQSS